MAFPTSHKTVFVLDHSLSSNSGVKIDLENLGKPKNGGNPQSPIVVPSIPLLPVVKTIWTCVVEALTEYCRIVWDIYPTSRLIRFIAVDKAVHKLNGWNADDQNLNSLMNHFMSLGPAKSGIKADLESGLKAAVEALTEPTAIQREKRSSLTDTATKVLNKGRIILATKFDHEEDVINIKNKFHNLVIQCNKVAASTDNLFPLNHCDFLILNFWKEVSTISLENRIWDDYRSFLSSEVFNVRCGVPLAPKLCSLVLRHYDLASTTVTGIPMKEEQNANSSANYDVELFHPSFAHTAILKGIHSETAHLRTVREGTDYETITLKWCTPRSSASSELQHCSSAYRITSVDVNSRPSSCLTNFLLNGRWVMLEMPRKSGSKFISHMLASHGGDIYIHTLYTSRSVLEDPPSISESVGGRVTDYRIPDFSDMIRMNLLAPYPDISLEEGEEAAVPLEGSVDYLKRHTKIWPITLSSSYLFSLSQIVVPMRNILVKDVINEDEIVECKNVLYALMNMEVHSEPLPVSSISGAKNKVTKREDQYKILWAELEEFLRTHLYSPGHKQVLDCLIHCQNKDVSSESKKDDKVGIDEALMEIDRMNGVNSTTEKSSDAIVNETAVDTQKKKRKMDFSSNLGTVGKKNSLSFFSLLEKMSGKHAQCGLEFQGRLKAENNITPLYTNLKKDKEPEELFRKK